MMRFLADENFNGHIVRGLFLRVPNLDLIRVQDTPLAGADDPTVLAFAAAEARVLLTHDVRTLTEFAYNRVRTGEPMPGVLEVPRTLAVGVAIADLLLIVEAATPEDFDGQVRYLPL